MANEKCVCEPPAEQVERVGAGQEKVRLLQKQLAEDMHAMGDAVAPVANATAAVLAAAAQVFDAYGNADPLLPQMLRLGRALVALQRCRTKQETDCLRTLVELERTGFSTGDIPPNSLEAILWERLGRELRALPAEIKAELLRDPIAAGEMKLFAKEYLCQPKST